MAERLNNTIETQINDGNTIVSQITDNNQPLQTVIQDVPQVQTVLQNGINVSSQINAPFVEVTSVNGKTGDVITEPVVGVFEPNHYYLKNTMIAHNNNLYYAKETFTSGSSFNANDWHSVEGSQITVDSALSTTSENPVQNKVITSALNNKVNSSDLAEVATSGSFTDLINVPVFPTVNNATLTIQKNGTTINTFTANSSTNKTANIAVPTKTSEIENDSDFLATEDLFATKSGTNINFTESEGIPLSNFSIKGNTVQNGTPTPEEPVPIQTVTGRQVVKVEGKNLLPNRMTSGTIAGAVQNTVNSDGSFTLNGTSTTGSNVDYNNEAGYYVHLEQGQKYTLSVNNSGLYWRIRKIATSTLIAQIDSPATSVTFTANTTEDAFLYFVVLNNSSFSNANFKVQLEQGSTATAYEPYQEQSYPLSLGSIELCKIGDYQDYIYKSGDKWYVHKVINKYTTTGSENWIEYRAGFYYAGTISGLTLPVDASVLCYSSSLKGCLSSYSISDFISEASSVNYAVNTHRNTQLLRIKNADMTSLAGFKTWLTANPTTVYYVLATPTDTEITNEALVAQLEAILSQGHTYAGTNNITTVISAGNAQGELEITYPKFFSKVATASSLGSIRVGDGLDITPEGTLSTKLGFTTESTSGNTKIIKLQDGTTTSYPITTKEAILGLDDDKFDASFLYDCTLDSTAFTQEQAEALKDAILADKEILIYEVNQSTNKGQYKPYYVSASEDSAFKTINVQYINQAPAQVMFSFMSINGADWTLTVRTTPL